MSSTIEEKFLYHFHNALLFNISLNTRVIISYLKNDDTLCLVVYMAKNPTNDEKDMYYSVIGEVIGKFPISKYKSEVIFSTEKFINRPIGSMILFAISDILDENGILIEE